MFEQLHALPLYICWKLIQKVGKGDIKGTIKNEPALGLNGSMKLEGDSGNVGGMQPEGASGDGDRDYVELNNVSAAI